MAKSISAFLNMAKSISAFLNQPFITPFNKNKTPVQQTPIKDYLTNQTAFSTAFGFFVCRLPFFQSAALGLATEGCRYVTDKAVDQLSAKFSLIRENRTVVKTALVAGSFFLAKAVINTILPGSSTLLKAGLLMSATYLVGEPIIKGICEAYTNEICRQYPTATQKIANLYSQFFGPNENRSGDNNS